MKKEKDGKEKNVGKINETKMATIRKKERKKELDIEYKKK